MMSDDNNQVMTSDGQQSCDAAIETNNDEMILAQEKQIEKDIAESIALVGNKIKLSDLINEYSPDDIVYRQKITDLQQQYQFIRKTRPDGNCFFRAFTYAYFESLLSDKQELDRFLAIAKQSKDKLVAQGFTELTVEDFHDQFMEIVKHISNGISIDDLVTHFNEQSTSDYLVVYTRLITSAHLQKESDFFSNFIEGHRTVTEFCKQEVEPMYKESDHIHIIALTSEFKVPVRIVYMDRGEGGRANTHDFGAEEGAQQVPKVHLLYRPGHYDILYLSE